MSRKHTVCLIADGIQAKRLRLQPWRYLLEVARQLQQRGCDVTILTGPGEMGTCSWAANGVSVIRLRSVRNYLGRPNRILESAVRQIDPDILLWHIGLTSFLHQRFAFSWPVPVIGIFTSPIYRLDELAVSGWGTLLKGCNLSGIHLIGACIPLSVLRRLVRKHEAVQGLVVQTETTKRQLRRSKIWTGSLDVIPPGVDSLWFDVRSEDSRQTVRRQFGIRKDEKVVVYFGATHPLRGLTVLLNAMARLKTRMPHVKLLILSRTKSVDQYSVSLKKAVSNCELEESVIIISGFLDHQQLATYVDASDVVALPFLLVPSDAPLAVLESIAARKPVVVTESACLPELAGLGKAWVAKPNNAASLACSLANALVHSNDRADSHTRNPDKLCATSPPRGWSEMGESWISLIKAVGVK